MPDWFYRTVSQPLLFALPADTSRRCVLGFMGALGNLPGGIGRGVIDLMGHMEPPPELRTRKGAVDVAGPVGASCWFDGEGRALAAWSRFGFGVIELGPAWKSASDSTIRFVRNDESRTVETTASRQSLKADQLCERASKAPPGGVRHMIRLCPPDDAAPAELAGRISEIVSEIDAVFELASLDLTESSRCWSRDDWETFWRELKTAVADQSIFETLCLVLTPTLIDDAETKTTVLGVAEAAGVRNWFVECRESLPDGRQRIGTAVGVEWLKSRVEELRDRFGEKHLVIGGGSVAGVNDALALRAAGADLVMLDTGMVYSGPGLAKRINHAFVSGSLERMRGAMSEEGVFRQSWFWGAMLGLGMFVGSLLALGIASTRVVLPYDEVLCGLTRDQLAAFNPRLLLFLAHDRVSLAGTMIAIGVLYGGMSLWGIRRGIHWPRIALFWSAGVGFASFFLFLGFGYFDPFHGFVTAILFQLYVQCMVCAESPRRIGTPPDLEEDSAWRRGLWGQLLLVTHGVGLLLAGATIATVGLLDVFVPSDLEFLGVSADVIRNASERLFPMIAHDRVTMGGMLIAAGIPFLLAALWGIGRGTRWLWWTMLMAGIPAYVCAIGVHFVIGYVDFFHLLPAWVGLALYLAGLLACRGWMWDESSAVDDLASC